MGDSQSQEVILGPKHLEQTTLSYTHFIENAQAKPRQHYHREIMDDHMNHSNWKKLICISKLSILRLNLCHWLIPDLSGPSVGEIPCCSQRASEG